MAQPTSKATTIHASSGTLTNIRCLFVDGHIAPTKPEIDPPPQRIGGAAPAFASNLGPLVRLLKRDVHLLPHRHGGDKYDGPPHCKYTCLDKENPSSRLSGNGRRRAAHLRIVLERLDANKILGNICDTRMGVGESACRSTEAFPIMVTRQTVVDSRALILTSQPTTI